MNRNCSHMTLLRDGGMSKWEDVADFLQDYNKASDNMGELQKSEKSDGEICEQLYLPGCPALLQ